MCQEVDYLTGRFQPNGLDEYMNCERVGRGRTPRVEKELRKRIIEEVVNPYSDFKRQRRFVDWNDLPGIIIEQNNLPKYQIIIADETQHFPGRMTKK